MTSLLARIRRLPLAPIGFWTLVLAWALMVIVRVSRADSPSPVRAWADPSGAWVGRLPLRGEVVARLEVKTRGGPTAVSGRYSLRGVSTPPPPALAGISAGEHGLEGSLSADGHLRLKDAAGQTWEGFYLGGSRWSGRWVQVGGVARAFAWDRVPEAPAPAK